MTSENEQVLGEWLTVSAAIPEPRGWEVVTDEPPEFWLAHIVAAEGGRVAHHTPDASVYVFDVARGALFVRDSGLLLGDDGGHYDNGALIFINSETGMGGFSDIGNIQLAYTDTDGVIYTSSELDPQDLRVQEVLLGARELVAETR